MSHILALPNGTTLADDYRIERILGAGGFGITYLATEQALDRLVTIKEYFPADFAHRLDTREAVPRSEGVAEDYKWGLDRFISEAQTLARFDHPNIVKVYRYFPAHSTAYMVLHFEEGQSLKSWLKNLGRAPRQRELDQILTPLLDALEVVHAADFLHRDIAPDNIIIRKDGSPVLIDFGSARGEIAQHSRTLSALVKPGYSPYEQYAETGHRQGPWTDIYALASTLYHAVSGKRPPDAPSRIVKDTIAPAREVALSSYRSGFLAAIDRALALDIDARPPSIRAWRGELLAPDPKPQRGTWLRRAANPDTPTVAVPQTSPLSDVLPPAPDAPGQQGGFLDFVDGLKKKSGGGGVEAATAPPAPVEVPAEPPAKPPAKAPASLLARVGEIAHDPARPAELKPASSARDDQPADRPQPAPHKRKVPRPKPVRPRRHIRPLLVKLAIGAVVASVVVAFQDRLGRPGTEPDIATPRAPGTPAREARVDPPARPKTSEIETRSLQVASPPETRSERVASAAVIAAPPASNRSAPQAVSAGSAAAVRFAAHRGAVLAAQFTGDSRSIVTLGTDRLLRSFEFENGMAQRVIASDEITTTLSVSGRRAAVGYASGEVAVFDLERGERTHLLAGGPPAVTALTFAGGDRLVASFAEGGLVLWDLKQPGRPEQVFEGHQTDVRAVAAHPLGVMLASGAGDGSIKMWDMARAAAVRTLRAGRAGITSIAFSPDGRVVASASTDGSVRLWSAATGRLMRVLRGPKVAIASLAYSPAGDMIATAWEDGTVRLTGTTRWRTLETWQLSGSAPRTVAFSPDGRYVATASTDGSVNGWSAIVGRGRDTE